MQTINTEKGYAMHRNSSPLPSQLDKPLEEFLTTHMPPSTSRVPPIYRETTKCYAYMCPFAYGCTEKTNRPAQVMMRRCMRYMPEELRIKPALSDFSLDLLAKQRESGEALSQETTAILDEYRPDGPVRKIALEA
ncbi:MAG: hypothetical protein QF368_03245 [SAR202 cluster bacterium]|nr:hypothetical protein [SAR202 cluster bacterium]